jgi:hypothetical protein
MIPFTQHRFANLCARAACALLFAATAGAAAAAPIHVVIDTANYGVATGYLDMQFSASAGVPLATARVTNLAGFDSNPYVESWGLTPVAGGYLFRNDTANDWFQSVHFGGLLSFDLDFAGAVDPATSYVSHFVVAAFKDDMVSPLGGFDPVTGALADFSWTPATTAQGQGTVAAAVSDGGVHVVPEPAGWMLFAAGLAALALPRVRQR